MDESDKKPPQVSKAPPPIEPLRGGSAPAVSKSGSDIKPDWNYWRQMPDAEIWKAVALSCDLEPRRGRFAEYWAERRRWRTPDEDERYRQFLERLEIAKARGGELEHASLNMGDSDLSAIKLPQFAAWALSMQWQVPQELADMANTASMKARKPTVKSDTLGTTERGTVLKIIAGFLAQGFKHDQIEKPYAVAKEIQGALQSAGLDLSDDTIANWIKEAAPLLTAGKTPKGSR